VKRLFLLAFIWGWSFLFIKVAVRGLTPSTVAAARMALGAGVLATVVRARRLSVPAGWAWWRHFAVVALFGSALPFTLLAWGEQHISSALTAVLNASTPLFAAVMAFALLGDRLTGVHVGGLLLGFVGVAVAAGLGASDLTGSSLGGAMAAVGASAGYGLAFAYTRRHLVTLPPLLAATGQLLAGTALLAPVAVVTSVRQGLDFDGVRPVVSVVLLGVFGTGVAYVLSYRLIGDVGPTRAALVTYLIPVIAVTIGVVFLDEPFSYRLAIGGALTVLGIGLLQTGNRVVPVTVQVPNPEMVEDEDASEGDDGRGDGGAARGGGSSRGDEGRGAGALG
jgi:drug/metabolite transporter (DMT)-like permease